MIALLPEHRLAFVGVPKCLTTTLLRVLYEQRYGKPYDAAAHDGVFVHDFWTNLGREAGLTHEPPSLDRLAGLSCFTVIRDPVERLLSAYVNRVADKKQIARVWERPAWRQKAGDRIEGLVPQPDPDFFFVNLARYRELVGTIRHHTDPFSVFLGSDLAAFERVFRADEAPAVAAFLSDRFGTPITLPRTQKSSHRLRLDDLSQEARRAVLAFTESDYDLLSDHYSAPGLAYQET